MCPFLVYKHESVVRHMLLSGLQQFASALQGEQDQAEATEDSQLGGKGDDEGGKYTSKENKSDKEDQGTV